MVDSWAAGDDRGALARIVSHINRADEQSIGFEWELVVLTGLGRLGSVIHEPKLDGTARVDFSFTALEGSPSVGDIVTISNKGYEADNPVEPLRKEFFRRVMKKGLSPVGFETRFGGKTEGQWGAQRVRALVPQRASFHLAFDRSFDDFLEAVKADRSKHHSFALRTDEWDVQFNFDPTSQHVFSGGPGYTISYDIERNPLMHALKRKAKQLKKVSSTGLKWIVVCDGHSDLLQRQSYSVGQAQPDEILRLFLRRNATIDLISIVTIEHGRNPDSWSFAPGPAEVHVRSAINPATGSMAEAVALAELFQQLPDFLPPPVADTQNAVAQLTWRYPREGRPFSGWYSLKFNRDGGGIVKIGSRTLLELLAGRIDSERFLVQNRYFGSTSDPNTNAFALMLNRGCMISKIEVEMREHRDDDLLVFHFGTPDPAIAPLSVSGTSSLPESQD